MRNVGITVVLSTLLFAQSMPSFAAGQNDIFGIWGMVKLQGDFRSLSPNLNKFKWAVMNQTRIRDDSSKGSRFFVNLFIWSGRLSIK